MQSCDHSVDRNVLGHKPHFPKTAQIDKPQFFASGIPEANACVTAGFSWCWMPLKLARHAQMNTPHTVAMPRLRIVELRDQVLPSSAPGTDLLPTQAKAQSLRSSWTRDCAVTKNLDVVNHERLKTVR